VADFVNFTDLFRAARDEVLAREGRLTRAVVERPGTDANLLLAGGAGAADEVLKQLFEVEAGVFLDTAVGQALDRWVFDRYGLLRKPASAAIGEVSFTTTAANPIAFAIPANTLLSTASGIQFVTTAGASFPFGSIGPIVVPVRSVLAGVDQQAAPNTITNLVSQITNQPTDLAVTNPLATAGADDDESDDSLRARARAFFTTARRGTIAAIEQGALAVPGVRTAQAFEVLDPFARPNRLVQLVVSDAFTDSLVGVSPVPTSYATQSQAFAATVFAGLSDVRAAGIFVDVIVAQVILLPITLHLTFNSGADPNETTSEAKAVAVNYTNGLAPGASFIVDDLIDQLRAIPGLFITGNEVASPNGDVVPMTLQALRTSLSIVTAPAV
jgi:hypothetical protein